MPRSFNSYEWLQLEEVCKDLNSVVTAAFWGCNTGLLIPSKAYSINSDAYITSTASLPSALYEDYQIWKHF